MSHRSVLRKLGLADDDRAVIFHADDVGMCQSTLSSYVELLDFGLLTSASLMVPCGWYPGAAAICRQRPEVDMGVHLTLSCEWESYRWRPLSTGRRESGLIDDSGYFHSNVADVRQNAEPAAVRGELIAQFERAMADGVDCTHVDSHMGALFDPRFAATYFEVACQYDVPALAIRIEDQATLRTLGFSDSDIASMTRLLDEAQRRGMPLLDGLHYLPMDKRACSLEQLTSLLDSLPPGVTNIVIHPAIDSPELRAITPDWPGRVLHHHLFTSEALRTYIRRSGIQLIDFRLLRGIMAS